MFPKSWWFGGHWYRVVGLFHCRKCAVEKKGNNEKRSYKQYYKHFLVSFNMISGVRMASRSTVSRVGNVH